MQVIIPGASWMWSTPNISDHKRFGSCISLTCCNSLIPETLMAVFFLVCHIILHVMCDLDFLTCCVSSTHVRLSIIYLDFMSCTYDNTALSSSVEILSCSAHFPTMFLVQLGRDISSSSSPEVPLLLLRSLL